MAESSCLSELLPMPPSHTPQLQPSYPLPKQWLKATLDAHAGKGHCTPHATALKEIQSGVKRSCWIWYVLPALVGLRKTSRPHWSLPDFNTARGYLHHPESRAGGK